MRRTPRQHMHSRVRMVRTGTQAAIQHPHTLLSQSCKRRREDVHTQDIGVTDMEARAGTMSLTPCHMDTDQSDGAGALA